MCACANGCLRLCYWQLVGGAHLLDYCSSTNVNEDLIVWLDFITIANV